MKHQLTPNDIKKMEEEIEHRKLVMRPELIEAVKEARAQGDLSENFEYYAAKREKNRNEGRIRYLDRMIRTAEIVSVESHEDEAGMDNTLELFFEEEGETETYRLVTTVREDPMKGLISVESPIGKAVFGHKEGDRVYVEIAKDQGFHVQIKKIIKTVDEGTDRLRSF
ncbi:MAG: GreA/GreB family elongation factor [Lachnospiraceae bacterium]|nr:GreA/GreB family elongation factor [Lachnospiraceae bacterium]